MFLYILHYVLKLNFGAPLFLYCSLGEASAGFLVNYSLTEAESCFWQPLSELIIWVVILHRI